MVVAAANDSKAMLSSPKRANEICCLSTIRSEWTVLLDRIRFGKVQSDPIRSYISKQNKHTIAMAYSDATLAERERTEHSDFHALFVRT